MKTVVRIDGETEARLEELQAEIRLRTGSRVSKQELLSRLVQDAFESVDDVVDSFRESAVPLSEEEKEVLRRGRFSSGTEGDEMDHDDVLYGR